jgi:superfamily II DNA or RNA helicase
VPNLNRIVLASSSKSKIRTLQSIGRSLRIGKGGQAYIYDIVDYGNPFLPKHAKERISYYEDAEFNIEHIELKEV